MNTKTVFLILGINLIAWVMIGVSFFMEGDAALDAMIACMGTMAVLAALFFREFFKAVRERQEAEERP